MADKDKEFYRGQYLSNATLIKKRIDIEHSCGSKGINDLVVFTK